MLQVKRYWQPSASLYVSAHPVKEATFAIAVKNGLECLNGAMPHEFCSCIRYIYKSVGANSSGKTSLRLLQVWVLPPYNPHFLLWTPKVVVTQNILLSYWWLASGQGVPEIKHPSFPWNRQLSSLPWVWVCISGMHHSWGVTELIKY
jgi:hypothetical protein